jgi:hypothetical protein
MDEEEFLQAIRIEYPEIENLDLVEALYIALNKVDRYSDEYGIRYFGEVAGGIFYADSDHENTRWYPDTSKQDALMLLGLDLGEETIEGLECSW